MPHTDTYVGDLSGTPDPDQMLTRKEAAALIGFSVSSLRRWDREGILTSRRSPTGQPRYHRGELLAAMAANSAA